MFHYHIAVVNTTMKVLLILALAAVCQCALLGTQKCTYGPSYWCSHIHNAKQCGAVQHCITTVWNQQTNEMTGATETCFNIIQIIDAVRKDSEPHLLEKMASGCTAFPMDKRSKCTDLMSHDQNEVFMLLQSDLPSHKIASALGLCGSFPDHAQHPQVTGDYCTDCVNFFTDIREIFNNSRAQVEDLVKNQLCKLLGPLESLCIQIADQYINMVYDVMVQQLEPKDVCFLLGLCNSSDRAEVMKSLKYILQQRQRASGLCDICESLTKDVQDALRDPAIQKEVMTLVETKVCPFFGNSSDVCKSYVEMYAPVVFQLLVSELDPQTICTMLGLCTNATVSASPILPVAIPLSGDAVSSVRLMLAQTKVSAGPQCALCELIMKELTGMLVNNATEEEVTQALEKVCNLLPQTLAQECDTFVEEYGKMVIELLMKEVSPKEICTLLGLCIPTKKTEPALEAVKPLLVQPAAVKVNNAAECMVCEEVITYVKTQLDDPSDQAQLEKLLEKACDILPSSIRAQCENFISTYTPTIIMLFDQFADPKEICTALGLCTAKKAQNPLVPMMELTPAKPHLLGSIKCTWGPAYWCQNEDNARECNAVEHCVKYKNLKIGA